MQKFILLLLCCFALANINLAKSVSSLNGNNDYTGGYDRDMRQYSSNGVEFLQGMSQVDLLRQKFLLDILFKVQEQLNENDIIQEYNLQSMKTLQRDMFNIDMNEDILYVLDLCNECINGNCRNNYSTIDEEFLRQMIGLYRLLVVAQDYETFQYVAFIARKCLDYRAFVYGIMYAVRDRIDTRMLYVPNVYEILPELYYSDVDVSENLRNNFLDFIRNDNVNTQRGDINGLGDKRYSKQIDIFSQMNNLPLWLPFRELHKQILYQRMISNGKYGNQMVRTQQLNKIVLPLEKRNSRLINGIELYTQDFDLEAYLSYLINRMVIVESQRNNYYVDNNQNNNNNYYYNNYYNYNNDYDNDNRDYRERNIKTKREQNYRDYSDLYNDRNERKYVNDGKIFGKYNNLYSRNDERNRYLNTMYNRRGFNYYYNNNNDDDNDFSYNRRPLDESLPTIDINDERLLYVGRRRMNELRKDQNRYQYTYNQDKSYRFNQQQQQQQDYDFRRFYNEQQRGQQQQQQQQRYSRSSRNMEFNNYNNDIDIDNYYRNGELFLHNLRQIIARYNLERYSKGEQISLRGNYVMNRYNKQQQQQQEGININDIYSTYNIQQLRIQSQQQQRVLIEYLNQIDEQINLAIDVQQKQYRIDINRLICDVLIGRRGQIGILQIIRQLQQQLYNNYNELSYQTIRQQIYLPVLRYFLQRIDLLRQQQQQEQPQQQQYQQQQQYEGFTLKSVNNDINVRNEMERVGVIINNVKVDKLRTYIDKREDDVINILPYNDAREALRSQKSLMVRQSKLNYKPFTYTIELNSQRAQRCVVRTFLAPKDVNVQREDFLLLDTQYVDLVSGQNIIKRNSNDLIWTKRETTSYSSLYQQVLLALNGGQRLSYVRDSQVCRYPDHLLLPRGRVDGLPMQLLIVVTKLDDNQYPLRRQNMLCALGVGDIQLDNLPLSFPLDRDYKDFVDIQQLEKYQNVFRTDVLIKHEEKIKY